MMLHAAHSKAEGPSGVENLECPHQLWQWPLTLAYACVSTCVYIHKIDMRACCWSVFMEIAR